MKRRLGALAAVTALTAVPAVAEAQDQLWLRDRKYTEGIGYRAGDFELHPGLAAEFGYDSNYFHRAPEEYGGPVGSLRLRITPSFSIATLGRERRENNPGSPPDVEFRGGVSATYNEFFPVSGPEVGQNLMHQQRNLGGNVDLGLTILPQRPWSGALMASYQRLLTASQEGLTEDSFRRDVVRAGGEVIWTPGSGLLDWRLGYQFSGTFFESSAYNQLNNMEHQIQTRGRWRFLPRTAVLYDARFGFITYPNPKEKTASHPVRAQIGVNGLITSSFGLLAMVGWGASFYTPNTPQENFNSVIGQLELKWFLTPNPSSDPSGAGLSLSTLSVGFIRDFSDSYIGTYLERDRGYANFSYFFAGRFLVVLDGGAGPIRYPSIPSLGVTAPFTDIRIDASLFGEYRIKNSFGINTTLRYGQNVSNTTVIAGGLPDSLKWQEFEAYLGARWLM